VHKLVNIYTKL